MAEHDAKLEERLGQGKGDPVEQVAAFIDFHLSLGADANPEMLACWILISGEALRQPEVQVEYEGAIAEVCVSTMGSFGVPSSWSACSR